MSLTGADRPVSEAAWRQLPSVYVRASEDLMPATCLYTLRERVRA
jgi:hypothetical protein